MTTREIIELLKENDFVKTKSFVKPSGIYAFFYFGNSFSLLGNSKNQQIKGG